MTKPWRVATNEIIAKNLLDHIAGLFDGRWYRTETLNSRGERTTRFTVEFKSTEESNNSDSDVPGSDTSNS